MLNHAILEPCVRTCAAPLCYLCGKPGELSYGGVSDKVYSAAGVWDVRRCADCGLMWVDPQPIPEDVGMLYPDYHTHFPSLSANQLYAALRRSVRQGILCHAFGYNSARTNWFEQFVGTLCSIFPPFRNFVGWKILWLNAQQGRSLLDIGCGAGDFMVLMKSLGWDVTGVEPDTAAVRVARDIHRLKVISGTVEQAALPSEYCDAITLNHVIEHLPDPVKTLRECRRLIRPGGRLAILTPNISGLGHRWFGEHWRGLEVPRHLFLFSPQSLEECVRRAGFKVHTLTTPARASRFTWNTSAAIRNGEALSNGSVDHVSWSMRLNAFVFQVAELFFTLFRPAGEEIFLMAEVS